MKALRKLRRGTGNMEIVDVPHPSPQEGEVIVEVKRAGVCGTDIHVFHDLYPKAKPPVTTGHEFSGEVVELGPNVEGWKIGDRVTVDSTAAFCATCRFCRSGQTQLCSKRLGYGSSKDGGFAAFASVHQDALHRLPEHVSFQEGALCEPLACATHAATEIASIEAGKIVLVTGPGPIGLLVLQVIKSLGAKVIMTGTEKDERRLQVAHRLGADHCIQIGRQDLSSHISQLTNGNGVDVALECSGAAGGVNDCFSSVRKAGEIVQIGLFGHPATLNYDEVALKEVRIKGSFGHNRGTWEKAINLLRERKVDLNCLVSGEFPLDRWQEAFELFEKGAGLKYLFHPIE